MKKKLFFVLPFFMAFLALVSCGSNNTANDATNNEENKAGDSDVNDVIDNGLNQNDLKNNSVMSCEPSGEYNEGIVLVKTKKFNVEMLGDLQYSSCDPLYKNSLWNKVVLKDDNTIEAVKYLSSLKVFDRVEYDYCYDNLDSIDYESLSDEYSSTAYYLDNLGIFDGWRYMKSNENIDGGSPSVVIAVIDSGVDYNHVDLRNNMWVNVNEIPNNGIDDDNNGYIDDYRGWDFVGNDNDPMDDNGHGTHVAGIISSEKNNIGTVGIAYNCKIMPLKAGGAQGGLSTSDICSAIQYAYMNGASIINMSFGGYGYSTAMKDVLNDAYYSCVSIAAAGNDATCNNPDCKQCKIPKPKAMYPAAFEHVIGVMSCDHSCINRSSFSNYDHYYCSKQEYDVYAPGEAIMSTYPNNRYCSMSGTSMASPVVAGVAALLRSYYSDRNTYSTKFIAAQIVGTGNKKIGSYRVVNIHDAFNSIPKPELFFKDYIIFDSKNIESSNNGDGLLDAGELVHLGIDTFNILGVAKNIKIKLSADENDGHTDEEYISIINNEISISNIGTYSTGTGGNIYDDGNLIDYENYFTLRISENCPHHLNKYFNVSYEYQNGLDENDKTIYKKVFEVAFFLEVSNCEVLSGSLYNDLTLTKDKKYIIKDRFIIENTAKLTIEEGVNIEILSGGYITSYGTIEALGTADNHINIWTDGWSYYNKLYGNTDLYYVDFKKVILQKVNFNNDNIHNIDHCWFTCADSSSDKSLECINTNITNSFVYNLTISSNSQDIEISGNKIGGLEYKGGSYKCNIFNNFIGGIHFSYCNDSNCDIYNNVIHYVSSEKTYVGENFHMNRFTFSRENYDGERDMYGNFYVNVFSDDDETGDYSLCWPHITSIQILNENDEEIYVVGSENVKFVVEFNTDMDMDEDFYLFFGSKEPYSDYRVTGNFVSATRWEGSYKVTSKIEGGQNLITLRNVEIYSISGKKFINSFGEPWYWSWYAYDDLVKKEFTIDMTNALSMTLLASVTTDGVNLTWVQDDYDTLMGYNIYRSETKDGNYTKINNVIIPSNENTFLDENAEPGKSYWYTFTVVLSDFSESAPAGKVFATMLDTEKPNLYHTPVNQGYLNNNLVIYCTASDNVGITSVILYYRTKGETTWKQLTMLKQNDKYSATIFGSELSLEGLEYYIVASDGVNTINKGNEESPYSVLIKDSSALAMYGDVDGDGIITTKDALMIIKAINGDLILTDDQFKRADLNKDNTLSSVEALRILQYINGNVITLEM